MDTSMDMTSRWARGRLAVLLLVASGCNPSGQDGAQTPPGPDAGGRRDAGRACAAECETGLRRCLDAQIQICADADGDGCSEWGAPIDCPSGTICGAGACEARCQHACAEGESICSAGGVRRCVKGEDGCRELAPAVSCAAGERCDDGACVPAQRPCENGCAADGDRECGGEGYRTFGQFDEDECLEWSVTVVCDLDEQCENAECVPSCTDACQAGELRCEGGGVVACGNFDRDGGADLQNGPDSVQHRWGDMLVDSLGYGAFEADRVFAGEGEPAPDVAGQSLSRDADHTDTDDKRADFSPMAPSPGAASPGGAANDVPTAGQQRGYADDDWHMFFARMATNEESMFRTGYTDSFSAFNHAVEDARGETIVVGRDVDLIWDRWSREPARTSIQARRTGDPGGNWEANAVAPTGDGGFFIAGRDNVGRAWLLRGDAEDQTGDCNAHGTGARPVHVANPRVDVRVLRDDVSHLVVVAARDAERPLSIIENLLEVLDCSVE